MDYSMTFSRNYDHHNTYTHKQKKKSKIEAWSISMPQNIFLQNSTKILHYVRQYAPIKKKKKKNTGSVPSKQYQNWQGYEFGCG